MDKLCLRRLELAKCRLTWTEIRRGSDYRQRARKEKFLNIFNVDIGLWLECNARSRLDFFNSSVTEMYLKHDGKEPGANLACFAISSAKTPEYEFNRVVGINSSAQDFGGKEESSLATLSGDTSGKLDGELGTDRLIDQSINQSKPLSPLLGYRPSTRLFQALWS